MSFVSLSLFVYSRLGSHSVRSVEIWVVWNFLIPGVLATSWEALCLVVWFSVFCVSACSNCQGSGDRWIVWVSEEVPYRPRSTLQWYLGTVSKKGERGGKGGSKHFALFLKWECYAKSNFSFIQFIYWGWVSLLCRPELVLNSQIPTNLGLPSVRTPVYQ